MGFDEREATGGGQIGLAVIATTVTSPLLGTLIEKLEVGITAQPPNGAEAQLRYLAHLFVLAVEVIGYHIANLGWKESSAIGQMPQIKVDSALGGCRLIIWGEFLVS